jgi:hypothetical protein
VERVSLLAQMATKQSECIANGGKWDGNECNFPQLP